MAWAYKPNVDVFEYGNFREFLRDVYRTLKGTRRGFSYRSFCKAAGFQSPNFLKLVIEGRRNLSRESVERLIRLFEFNGEQGLFFTNLVLLNQAEDSESRRHYAEQLVSSKAFRKIKPLIKAQYDCYANWYHVPIRELVDTSGFRPDPAWISTHVAPGIKESEAKAALENLLKLGLIKEAASGGYVQSDRVINTDDEVSSASVASFHRQMMKLAGESIDRFPRDEREISSATFGVSKANVARIKEMIQRFRREILALAEQEQKPEVVYQLNFQLFPVTLPDEEPVGEAEVAETSKSQNGGKDE